VARNCWFLNKSIFLFAVQLQLYCVILTFKYIVLHVVLPSKILSVKIPLSHLTLKVTCSKKGCLEKICSEQLRKNLSVFPKVSPVRVLSQALTVFLSVRATGGVLSNMYMARPHSSEALQPD